MRERSGSTRYRAAVLLVAECALVIACLTAQLPHLWEERWIQDDAYVSFRYARNLVRSEGLVYNVGERVEGYTNFLWTALAAVPLVLGAGDPLPFMHTVALLLWWASYALLLFLTVALWSEGVWAAPLGLLPLAMHWSFNMWFFSGMETPLVTFLTIAAVACVTLDPRRHRWSLLGASACGVGLMMTRPDGAVVLAALGGVVLILDGGWIFRRAAAGQRRRWTRLLAPLTPLLLVWLPYQVWRVWYYGSFFPNTYYAKLANLTYYERGWRYLREYALQYGLRPFVVVALFGAVLVQPGMARRFLWAALAVGAAVSFYVVRLGGDFMEWRFLTPASAVFYPAVVVAAAVVGERLAAAFRAPRAHWPLLACLHGVVAALLAAVTRLGNPWAQTLSIPDQETIPLLRRYTDAGRFDWRAAGALCDSLLPRDARIATTSAGIIPYLCDRHCLDLHGLTDPTIARGPVNGEGRGRMGHEHWLQDYGAVRERGVDVVVEWADPHVYPRAVAAKPHDGQDLVSARLPDGRFIDFTVLNPELLPALRRDPRVVLYDPDKIAAARELLHRRRRHAGMIVDRRLAVEASGSRTISKSISSRPARTNTAGTPSCCAICHPSTICSSRTTAGASTGGRSGRCSMCRRRAPCGSSPATITPARPAMLSRSTAAALPNGWRPPAVPTNGGARPRCAFRAGCSSTEPTPSASPGAGRRRWTRSGTTCGSCSRRPSDHRPRRRRPPTRPAALLHPGWAVRARTAMPDRNLVAVGGDIEREPNAAIDVSVVIPIYNEAPSIPALHQRLAGVLDDIGRSAEVWYIDDGSSDASLPCCARSLSATGASA
jgi:arabinofuranosyltransferase